jgi:hypothetical protein
MVQSHCNTLSDSLSRTFVNKGKKKGRSYQAPVRVKSLAWCRS